MEEPHLSASGAQQGAISHASLNPPQIYSAPTLGVITLL